MELDQCAPNSCPVCSIQNKSLPWGRRLDVPNAIHQYNKKDNTAKCSWGQKNKHELSCPDTKHTNTTELLLLTVAMYLTRNPAKISALLTMQRSIQSFTQTHIVMTLAIREASLKQRINTHKDSKESIYNVILCTNKIHS